MTEPREPEDYGFKPPMTARRETPPTWKVGRLVSRATPSMPPRARARHFASKGAVQRVRQVRSAAGGMRRVMVKVRVVPMTPGAKKALMTHVRYVAREGAGIEGEQGRFFDAREDAVDASGFARRCEGDRHHFRIIVNPEDGRDLPDLKAFTRRFMDQVSTDMGTPLEWVAGEHYDSAGAASDDGSASRFGSNVLGGLAGENIGLEFFQVAAGQVTRQTMTQKGTDMPVQDGRVAGP